MIPVSDLYAPPVNTPPALKAGMILRRKFGGLYTIVGWRRPDRVGWLSHRDMQILEISLQPVGNVQALTKQEAAELLGDLRCYTLAGEWDRGSTVDILRAEPEMLVSEFLDYRAADAGRKTTLAVGDVVCHDDMNYVIGSAGGGSVVATSLSTGNCWVPAQSVHTPNELSHSEARWVLGDLSIWSYVCHISAWIGAPA